MFIKDSQFPLTFFTLCSNMPLMLNGEFIYMRQQQIENQAKPKSLLKNLQAKKPLQEDLQFDVVTLEMI